MEKGGLERVAPLAGAAFAVLFAVGFLTSGETPDTKATGEEVIAHYKDSGKVFLAIFTIVIGAVLFAFFAGALRDALRAAGREWLATVAFAGGIVYSVGLALFAMSQVALSDAADLGQPQVAQALNILDNDNFFPAVVGFSILLLATGLHVLGSGVLPRWLGVLSLVMGVVAVAGPAGFVVFLAFPLWVLGVSVLLYRRPRVVAAPA